ncbi:hypothetical protein ACQP1K_01530 [Sphaerimonospora sp. CA-214678]|uniref:hypothetical protein n=1 Tax=Sphaerimonospora sp. CA-214678 TaxID=3240029 RepID=UPI003D8E88B2
MLCQPAQAAVSEWRQGAVVATDVVDYRCRHTGTAEEQDIKVKVALTMPLDVTTGKQMTIGWHGTYVDDSLALRVPTTGLAGGTKLYAYASISGVAQLTSATGVGELAQLTPGETITLPTADVPMKTTSANAGTATVRPAAINFGTVPTEPLIECEVQNAGALMTYDLVIAAADGRPAVTGDGTDTGSDTDTDTSSVPMIQESTADTVNDTTNGTTGNGKVRETPAGGVATGGGGEAGPDGRVLVWTGLLLTLTASSGLMLRRRRHFGRGRP